jgi:hypothetical protein
VREVLGVEKVVEKAAESRTRTASCCSMIKS